MPEPPDFDQLAGRLGIPPIYCATVAEQLRQVWNARGAADLVALEPIIDKLGDTMDPDNARVFVGDHLRRLDR